MYVVAAQIARTLTKRLLQRDITAAVSCIRKISSACPRPPPKVRAFGTAAELVLGGKRHGSARDKEAAILQPFQFPANDDSGGLEAKLIQCIIELVETESHLQLYSGFADDPIERRQGIRNFSHSGR